MKKYPKTAATKVAKQFIERVIKFKRSKPKTCSIPVQTNQVAKNHSAAAIPTQTAIKSNGTGAKKTTKQNNDLPSKFGRNQKSKSDVIALKNVNHSVYPLLPFGMRFDLKFAKMPCALPSINRAEKSGIFIHILIGNGLPLNSAIESLTCFALSFGAFDMPIFQRYQFFTLSTFW